MKAFQQDYRVKSIYILLETLNNFVSYMSCFHKHLNPALGKGTVVCFYVYGEKMFPKLVKCEKSVLTKIVGWTSTVVAHALK
jgi:hypothetical protein